MLRSNDRNLAKTFCKRAGGQVAMWPVANSTAPNGQMTSCNATAVFMLQVWINGASGFWIFSGFAPNHEHCPAVTFDQCRHMCFSRPSSASASAIGEHSMWAAGWRHARPLLASLAFSDHTLASLTTRQRAGLPLMPKLVSKSAHLTEHSTCVILHLSGRACQIFPLVQRS